MKGRRRFATVALTVLTGAGLIGTAAASAAVEIGDPCVASTATEAATVFQLASPGGGLPLEAPTSGVITSWKLNAGSVSRTSLQALKVFRVGRETAVTSGESPLTQIHAGANVIAARLPIMVGERLGLVGRAPISRTLLCAAEAPDRIGVPEGPGSRGPYDEIAGYRVPVRAVIELDADRDGYGDETQDRCPTGAPFQTRCPRVTLRRAYVVGPNAVTVRVASNRTTLISLFGSVKLGNASWASTTQPRQVAAAKERAFRFPLPKAVRRARARLGPRDALTLRLQAGAVDVRGPLSNDWLRVRLTALG